MRQLEYRLKRLKGAAWTRWASTSEGPHDPESDAEWLRLLFDDFPSVRVTLRTPRGQKWQWRVKR